MHPILILKTGCTFAETAARQGDFEDWIIQGLDLPSAPYIVLYPCRADRLPPPDHFSGIIITGSHAMLTRSLPWMRQTADWLAQLPQSPVPVLGICFGHHLLARALGGKVRDHPLGEEIGPVRVQTTRAARSDPLLHGFCPCFSAYAAHSQSASVLPPGAVLLARNNWEPHHAFRYGDRIWGLQFHPEFSRETIRDYRAGSSSGTPNGADRFPGDPVEAEVNGRAILCRYAEVVLRVERAREKGEHP
ncbi:MAG: glutamine amidotransferase [Desulfohalobiaceae bacterium]